MKKLFISIFILFLISGNAFASIDSATGEIRRGYMGTLPDVTQRFDRQRSELARPAFSDVETFRDKNELKPVPRDNPAYIDLIVKKHKLSPYTNDINDAIPLVESMIEAINHNLNIQKFVARVNAFNDWMSYFKSKYKDKPEAYYISFQKLVEIDFQSHYLATIKYESRLYNPYLPYSAEGAMYSPKAIQTQTNALLVELKKTLEILKDVN